MNSWSKIVSLCTLSYLLVQPATAFATEGYDHGNGGDYIRELFEQSRHTLANKISQLRPCSFQNLDTAASAWILKNQAQYVADILQSPHYWTVDARPTCGFTDLTSKQGIFFSYPTCINTSNAEDKAMFTLAHESVHHFGVSDEAFADKVARTTLASLVKDSCREGYSAFDPHFCQGENITQTEVLKFFTPGESISNYIAPSYIRRRIRNCNQVGGCGAFKEVPVTYIMPQPDGVADVPMSITNSFEPKDDFRFKITFDRVDLVFPTSLRRFPSGCSGNVSDKPTCRITVSASPQTYYADRTRVDTFSGKVTNRCFKMLESHNSKASSLDGSYTNEETVWYAEY